jgi:hypothetical protein
MLVARRSSAIPSWSGDQIPARPGGSLIADSRVDQISRLPCPSWALGLFATEVPTGADVPARTEPATSISALLHSGPRDR